MLKKILAGVIIFVVILMVALAYITARYVDKEEILRAKTEREQLRAARDSLLQLVADKTAVQDSLQDSIFVLQAETEQLRNTVDSLETVRQTEQLAVRFIRKEADLQARFRETFPEMAYSDWGVTEVYNPAEDVSLRYLSVPLWFSETFIIDHQNARSYRQQRDKLLVLDSLQNSIGGLKDSLLLLETEKRLAYQNGYNEAYAKYDTLSRKYINLLEKPPQVKFGIPHWGTLMGAAAAGTVLGTQLQLRK